MRHFTNSSSITTSGYCGPNGCFVGAIRALRSFLNLTFTRDYMGFWQEIGHLIHQPAMSHRGQAGVDKRLGKIVQLLWLIATPASQLTPAAARSARLDDGRKYAG